jgi:hypothetical protein
MLAWMRRTGSEAKRNGKWEIFTQGLKENLAQAAVEGPNDYYTAEPSPDGSWLLYAQQTRAAPGVPSPPVRLMRRPFAGGSPETVLEVPPNLSWGFWCARKPGASCVLGQREGKSLAFYSLDPVRGKGEQLGKIEGSETSDWKVSPDGSQIALVDIFKDGGIEVLTLPDHTWHSVSVERRWGALSRMLEGF